MWRGLRLTRLMTSLLFGVSGTDPATFTVYRIAAHLAWRPSHVIPGAEGDEREPLAAWGM